MALPQTFHRVSQTLRPADVSHSADSARRPAIRSTVASLHPTGCAQAYLPAESSGGEGEHNADPR
jgi:hypothetical protein